MFSYMVKKHIDKGGRVLVFTHRDELLTQAGGAFERFGLKPDYITADNKPDLTKPLHVAMIETFNKRKDDYSLFLHQKTLLVIDEAHLQNFTKIFEYIPDSAIVIGATATPFREPKAIQMGEFYTSLVHEVDTKDLIKLKKLTPARSFGVEIDMKGMKKTSTDYDTSKYYEENKLYEGVVKNWEKHSLNEKTILFASNIKSSKDVCEEFVRKGYNAKHIDGKMKKERKEILDWFDKTPNAILCNCGILTAGFDQADIKTVILYRATTSLPLFLQMCGRGSRLFPGKKYFKILDFGNNIQRHGFWEDDREWKLTYKKKKDKLQESPIKICPKCDAMNRASAKTCIGCGFVFPIPEPTKEEVILKELRKIETKGKRLSEMTMEELITLQLSKKYKSSFIWRVVRTRKDLSLTKYAIAMNYSDGWIYRQEQEDIGFNDFIVR